MLNNFKNLFLNRYKDKDYTLIQKSKILFSILFFVFLISLLMLIFNIFRGHTAPEFQIPLSALLLTSLLSFIILQRGFYEISSYLLIASVTVNFWIIMFMDLQQPLISRMGSIIYIQVNIILVPLLILRKKPAVLLAYYVANLLVFYAFSLHISSILRSPASS
jgi:hypothetical protein